MGFRITSLTRSGSFAFSCLFSLLAAHYVARHKDPVSFFPFPTLIFFSFI